MQFDNTPTGGGDSYEKPKPGKYLGVLVGFAYLGTQPGGQYGPKPKVMLRWELHKRRGPSYDSKNFIHTITARYGATVRGQNSLLKQCLEAHGINVAEGGSTSSQDWLGHAAWLDIESTEDGKYVNVNGVSKLDPEDDEVPAQVLDSEHWDDLDAAAGRTPPDWAAWAVAKSTDLAHLAPKWAGGGGDGNSKTATPTPVPAGVGAGADDDDNTPF